MKRAVVVFALAFSLSAPAFAADPGQGRGRDRGSNDGLVFETQGQCQSQLIQLRNDARRLTGVNVSGSTTSFVCKLITKGPLAGLFEIVAE